MKFTSPAPGATLPSGPLTISWVDAGGDPNLSNLTTYLLTLVVGGILDSDSKSIATLSQPNALVQDLGFVANIPKDVGQSIQNGYYLCMTSNTTKGNQVINYSNRFTLIELNGTTDSQYVLGAGTAVGDANVPGNQYIVNNQGQPAAPSTTAPSPTTSTLASGTSSSTPSNSSKTGYSIGSGELAGLLVGTLVAIILFLVLVVLGLIWWRKKRKARQEKEKAQPNAEMWSGKLEVLGSDVPATRAVPLVELSPDQERYEIETPIERVEADSEIRYELEGDWAGWEAAARRSQAYDPTR